MGVDFGTEFSALASFGPDGLPHVRPNARGDALTPSALTLTAAGLLEPADGLADAGDPAEGAVALDAFKRMLADGRGTLGRNGAPLTAGGTADAAGVPVTPGLLGAACLRGLADGTAGDLPPDAPAVLTVPHAFTSTPRRAILDAGRLAGLNVAGTLLRNHGRRPGVDVAGHRKGRRAGPAARGTRWCTTSGPARSTRRW